MIKLSPVIFMIGGILTFLPLFISNISFYIIVMVLGMIISLFIWFSLSFNRDYKIKKLLENKLISEQNLSLLKIRKKSIYYAILYSLTYTAMNIASVFSVSKVEEMIFNGDVFDYSQINVSDLDPMYVLASMVMLISSIASIILLYFLFKSIYTDEFSIQTLLMKQKNIQVPALKPMPFFVYLVFTIFTYGLFSWFFRYRISKSQMINLKLEEKVKLLKDIKEKQEKKKSDDKKKSEDFIGKMKEHYSNYLRKDLDNQKRKEVLARLYMDLGKIDPKEIKNILDDFLSENLLKYDEYKKLENLLF
ncbi:MAG: hypothetical protein PWQ77_925 [Kosmotogales bacterium]|nr:hypothetical protein [Kosmotogales bacterium]